MAAEIQGSQPDIIYPTRDIQPPGGRSLDGPVQNAGLPIVRKEPIIGFNKETPKLFTTLQAAVTDNLRTSAVQMSGRDETGSQVDPRNDLSTLQERPRYEDTFPHEPHIEAREEVVAAFEKHGRLADVDCGFSVEQSIGSICDVKNSSQIPSSHATPPLTPNSPTDEKPEEESTAIVSKDNSSIAVSDTHTENEPDGDIKRVQATGGAAQILYKGTVGTYLPHSSVEIPIDPSEDSVIQEKTGERDFYNNGVDHSTPLDGCKQHSPNNETTIDAADTSVPKVKERVSSKNIDFGAINVSVFDSRRTTATARPELETESIGHTLPSNAATVNHIKVNAPPGDIEPLEAYLKAFRQQHDLSLSDMADLLGSYFGYYGQIERGIIARPGTAFTARAVESLRPFMSEGDDNAAAISSILTQLSSVHRGSATDQVKLEIRATIPWNGIIEFKGGEVHDMRSVDQRWYGLFDQEDMTKGDALRSIRLGEYLSRKEFATESGIPLVTLGRLETQDKTPEPGTVKRIIEASLLPTEGGAAQRLRLLINNMGVMTDEDFRNASRGEVLRYLRILEGMTLVEKAAQLGYLSQTRVIIAEKDGTLTKDNQDKIQQNWLNTPEDAILIQKILEPDAELDDDVIKALQKSRFLFKPANALTYDIPGREVPDWVQADLPIGKILRVLRTGTGMSLRDVERELINSKLSPPQISEAENGHRPLADFRIASLLRVYGYDIHHPVTQYIIKKTNSERKTTPS
ncbi:MAG: hypothetical protein H0W89_05100 [Candidatus Levybacteria bacterium]|nr:hypothetical protein [Candidatus Levybacteria bacterium]